MSNLAVNKQDDISTLSASEYNQFAEINNLISSAGITADANVLNQVAKSVANYSNASNFFTENGTVNNYVLIASGSFLAPTSYINGMVIRFITTNANTTTTPTVNLAGLGARNILKENGSPVVAGDINGYVELRYNGTDFLLKNQGIPYLNNPVSLVNDGISLTDTIGFNAGIFITSTGKQIYLPTIRKKIQSSGVWTAGDTNNGLDTGARVANTFYRTFVIQNNSTSAYDILFSVSATSPTVPSGYTNLGLMDYALIRTNTSNIIAISNWDANNKKLVLGAGESIEVFNLFTAVSGNATIVSTTEPLEFVVRTYLATNSAGNSDLAVYGSEHSASDPNDTVLIATNNGFLTAGGGSVYTSDGKIYWKNFRAAGGVGQQVCKIKAIKIRS